MNPPSQPITLRAGKLTLLYENADVRYIRLGDTEILRRIYAAVRDPNWGTIPANIRVTEWSIQPDSFTIRFHAEHRQGGIHFEWDGAIIGSEDSTLTLTMDGAALSTFLKNRIGICVLHPMTLAGSACVIADVDGGVSGGSFPVEIMPFQPFSNIRAITHEIIPGVGAEVRCEGDIFEMEDQRNWTDASYKTYSTPVDLPIPTEIAAGTRVQQSVTLRLIGTFEAITVRDVPPTPTLTVDPADTVGKLPRLGLAGAGHGQPLTPTEIARLRLLNLSHLRADVRFAQPDWEARLRQHIGEAKALGVALEIALQLTADVSANLAALRRLLDAETPAVARWLVFADGHAVTPPDAAKAARRHLADYAPSAPFAGGADSWFVQVNRFRPDLTALNLLTYAISPQIHAFDNASMVETLPTQAVTLDSARRFIGNREITVSPVTLKMRNNPAATRPDAPQRPGELPKQVDPRQRTLFAAGWTLGSIKYLGEGGAHSVTYYETTGWLGVMEAETPTHTAAQFPSRPGEIFPLFQALADVGEWADASIIRAISSLPLVVEALVLRRADSLRILVVNFTDAAQSVTLTGVQGNALLYVLDEQTASTDSEAFRAVPGQPLALHGDDVLTLAPFALARLDLTPRGDTK